MARAKRAPNGDQVVPRPRLACCGGWEAHRRSCAVCPPVYEPAEGEPAALQRRCPACGAARGSWCGGFNDVHLERLTKAERAARLAELEREADRVRHLEAALQG